MKTRTEVNRKLAMIATLILFICMVIIMSRSQVSAQSHLRKYKTLQTSMEYPAWQAKQKQVRTYRAKASVKYSKEMRKNANQTARLNEKIARIKSRSK